MAINREHLVQVLQEIGDEGLGVAGRLEVNDFRITYFINFENEDRAFSVIYEVDAVQDMSIHPDLKSNGRLIITESDVDGLSDLRSRIEAELQFVASVL